MISLRSISGSLVHGASCPASTWRSSPVNAAPAKARTMSAAIGGPMTRAPRQSDVAVVVADALRGGVGVVGDRRADAVDLAGGDRDAGARRRRRDRRARASPSRTARRPSARDVGVVVGRRRGRPARGRRRAARRRRRRAAGRRRGRSRTAILIQRVRRPSSWPAISAAPSTPGLRAVARDADLGLGAHAAQMKRSAVSRAGCSSSSPAVRDAAADRDHVGVEGVDDVGDADAEPLAEDPQRTRAPAASPRCAGLDGAAAVRRPRSAASRSSARPEASRSSEPGCGDAVRLAARRPRGRRR